MNQPTLPILYKNLPVVRHACIRYNEYDMIAQLIRSNQKLIFNMLIFATELNNYDLIDAIVTEFNIDINFDDSTLLNVAVKYGSWDTVEYLLTHGIVMNQDAIQFYCSRGDESSNLLTLLIEYKADVRANNDNALRWSAKNGNIKHVKILLNENANVHALDDYALRASVYILNPELMKLLLAADANVQADNNYCLRYMVKSTGFVDCVKLLLDVNADVHANNDEALIDAVFNHNTNHIKLLLEYNANVAVLRNFKFESENDNHILDLWHILKECGVPTKKIILFLTKMK